ncbi:MAG TPA: hypothetical protein VGS07_31090 [Thermoanaerobaculia bacterium]|nr:hypothetical protein [Thermoanaerobaculia bacterium]
MIRIVPQLEPPDFDKRVRQPGLRALAKNPVDFSPFWRHCVVQLWDAYQGICAYLCIYIPRGTGARSVDHLAPKSGHPSSAYEWSNYRLVCSLMNSRKREFEDVLDPFEIENGWFILDPTFLQVLPSPSLDATTRGQVQATINRLKLNDEECLEARWGFYREYIDGHMTFALFAKWSPFVAAELKRQGLA